MTKRLGKQDRQAVDLMMDSANRVSSSKAASYAAPSAMPDQRLHAVQRVLSLLDYMPVTDPPADLVARTLSTVFEAADAAVIGENAAQSELHQRLMANRHHSA